MGKTGAAPSEGRTLPPLTTAERALLEGYDRAGRNLGELVWKEGPQQDYPGIAEHPRRLDAWLARGGMTARLAASRSPKAVLDHFVRRALAEVDRCLAGWTPAGKDYLLAELLLVVRDRWIYYYGGSPRPRAVQLLGTGRSPAGSGRIMVTLSQGHREIWDPSPDCSSPKIAWSDVSWIRNSKAGGQSLRLVKQGRILDFKPRGGRIIDHDGFAHSGVTILSEDEEGGVWLQRFSLETRKPLETFSTRDKLPDPFPDWAVPFRSRWP